MLTQNDKSLVIGIGTLAAQVEDAPLRERLQSALRGDEPARHALRQEILSGEEVARVLNITRRSVVRYAREGVLRPVKMPGRCRAVGYSRESVERILAAAKEDGAA